ncbi:hypothetical protein [Psychroserpens mesophilus]|uniref:hypothetical protein n=1 Tax=Psychroserpens mesophilus TaxID=325473 RepID=UPI00058F320F|nr:hypothetical protein [Psychroserpens mesophilus]
MKKLLLLTCLICSALSCSPDDNGSPDFYYETLPIAGVSMPSEFQFGSTQAINMSYYKPSGCHVFNDFYYQSNFNQKTVAVITAVFPNQECETFDDELETVTFNLEVNETDPYVFRFWQGIDDNGNDVYYIIEVPVVVD